MRRPRNNDAPLAMSISSAQILVSNTIFQEKVPELFGEMIDSRTGTGYIQNEPGTS